MNVEAARHDGDVSSTLGRSRIYALGEALSLSGKLLLAVVVARMLGPHGFGVLELSLAIAVTAAALATQWLQQALLRFLPAARSRDIAGGCAGEPLLAATLSVPVTLVVSGLTVLAARSVLVDQGWTLWLLTGLFCLSTSMLEPMLAALQAKRMALHQTAWRTLGKSAAIVIAIGALSVLRNVKTVLAAMSVVGLLAAYGAWRSSRLREAEWSPDFGALRPWIRYGAPLSIWFAAFALLNLGDRLVINWYRGQDAVGVYGANYQLVVAAISVAVAPILTAAHPDIIAEWTQQGRSSARLSMGWFVASVLCIGTALVGALAIAGPAVVVAALGASYSSSGALLLWVALGLVAWQIGMYSHKGLEIHGRTWTMSLLAGGAACLNILLNVVFVPKLGLVGAALSTFFAYAAYLILTELFGGFQIVQCVPWRLVMPRIALVALVAAVGWYAIRWIAATNAVGSEFAPELLWARVLVGGAVLLVGSAGAVSLRWGDGKGLRW